MSKKLPTHAQVVVIGGGIVGCSVAYHLTKLGWKDVVLLERKTLTSGTTWAAAGLVGQLWASSALTKLAKYGTELYSRLEGETGYYDSDYCIKSTAREDQADEYREILSWFAFDQARRQFYGGKMSVKAIPITRLLEALA